MNITMRGSEQERIIQRARANGWKEGEDYVCGMRDIWHCFRRLAGFDYLYYSRIWAAFSWR